MIDIPFDCHYPSDNEKGGAKVVILGGFGQNHCSLKWNNALLQRAEGHSYRHPACRQQPVLSCSLPNLSEILSFSLSLYPYSLFSNRNIEYLL